MLKNLKPNKIGGQLYEHLCEYDNLVDTLLVPKVFKNMKIVSHSQRVFDTFMNNYQLYVAAASASVDFESMRDKLMSQTFVSDFLFLRDVCHKLAICFKLVQLHGLLPWDYPVFVNDLKSKLNIMLEQIESIRN